MNQFSPSARYKQPLHSNDCAAIARRSELQRLLPLWPCELSDLSLTGRRRVVHLLWRALREERLRARSGHWAYDVARHAALARTYRREKAEIAQFERREARRRTSLR